MSREILWAGYPKSYTPGRKRAVQFVTLHYTAGSEGPTSAESGVAYDKVRTDGTSAHYYTDSVGPALQEVPDGDRAHTARKHGNEIGIHIEICGTVQSRAQWLDATSMETLRTTAYVVGVLLQRHNLAFRRLTVDETRAAYYSSGSKPTGINDHNACTKAFPEDGGTHTDVGPEFPWDVFMDLVADELGAGVREGNMAIVFDWKGKVRMGFGPVQGFKTMQDSAMYGQWRSAYNDPPCYPDKDSDGYPTETLEQAGFTEDEVHMLYGYDMDEVAPPPPGEQHNHDFTVTGTTGPAKPVEEE